MPASAPASDAPVSDTTLFAPTFLFANVAEPPDRLTASVPTTPDSARESAVTVAAIVPSYALSAAAKLPVIDFGVMLAVVVAMFSA